jgi:WD40 repeat protein
VVTAAVDEAAQRATERIDELRRHNPNAVRLAALVSTAMRVEPELLRRCRLLLAEADVTAEADLWASDLLAGASPVALTLRPEVARALRSELAALPAALRDEACRLVAAQHRDQHWSARLEERVNELEVRLGSAALDEQEALLLAAVRELREAAQDPSVDRQVQVDIARWLLGALARLPAHLGRSEAGFAAQAAGSIHLDRRTPDETDAPEGERERWLGWLLASADVGQRLPIGVRFTPGRLELNAAGPDTATVDLPATTPVVVDVEARGRQGVQVTRVQLASTDLGSGLSGLLAPVVLPVDVDEVVLGSLDGRRWTVRRGGVPPPAGFDFAEMRAGLRPCLARGEAVARTVDAVMGRAWWTVVTGAPGVGASTVLNAALDEVERMGKGVVVSHFFGVDPTWDDPDAIVASIDAQLRRALRPYGELPQPDPDLPGAHLGDVLGPAGEMAQRLGGIVVAVDGVPGGSADDVKQAMWRLPFPSQPPPGVRYLVSTHHAGGIRDWLEDGDPIERIDLGGEAPDVCREMIAWAAPELRVAFATVPTVELTEFSGAIRIPIPGEPPYVAELTGLSAGNPGRLARLLDWIAAQPPNSVTLDRLPAPLTGRDDEAWEQLERVGLGPTFTGPAVVAGPGCTVADVARAARWTAGTDQLAELLGTAEGLLRIEPAADPSDTVVGPVDPSVVASFTRRYGEGAVTFAHSQHAAIWQVNGPRSPASPYALRNAALHLTMAAAEAEPPVSEVAQQADTPAAIAPVTIIGDVDYLARLVRSAGSQAAREAVARTGTPDPWRAAALDRVLATVGPVIDAEPDLAAGAVVSEWVRLGRDPAELGAPYWPPVLQLERIVDLDTVQPDWFHEVTAPLAAIGPDGHCYLAARGGLRELDPLRGTVLRDLPRGGSAPTLLAAGPADVALAMGGWLLPGSGDEVPPIPTRAAITAIAFAPAGAALGHPDGTITIVQAKRRVLTAHPAALTRLLENEGTLVSAAADGTVCVWEADLRRRLVYRRHRAAVRHLVAGPSFVVSADDSGRVRAWSPVTGDDLVVLPGHRAAVTGIVEFAGGIVTTAVDGSVLWWDLDDEVHRTLRAEGPPVAAVAVVDGPDGGPLLVTAEADGTVRWWDIEQGERRAVRVAGVVGPVAAVLGGPLAIVVHAEGIAGISVPDSPALPDEAAGVALDTSGRQAIVSTPTGWAQVDLTTGELRRDNATADPATRRAMALVDYPRVAWLHDDGTVRTGAQVVAEAVERIAGDPARQRLVLAGTDGSVTFLGVDPSGRRQSLAPPGAPVTALTVELGRVLTGRLDGTVHLEDPATGSSRPSQFAVPGTVTALALATSVCVGCSDGTVWRVDGTGDVRPMGRHEGPVTGMVALKPPEADLLPGWPEFRPVAVSAGRDGLLRAWDLSAGRCIGLVATGSEITSLDAANGTLVARTRAGDLWVVQARLPRWRQPSTIGGAGISTPPALANVSLEVSPEPGGLRVELVGALDLESAMDLVALRLDLVPPAPAVAQRYQAGWGDSTGERSPAIDLVGPWANGDVYLVGRATFGTVVPPEAVRVELVVTSPDLGGPVTLTGTIPAPAEARIRSVTLAPPPDDPAAPPPRDRLTPNLA